MYHTMNRWTPYFLLFCMFAVVHGSNKKPHKNNPSGESGIHAEHSEHASEPSETRPGATKMIDYLKSIRKRKVHAPHDVNSKDDDDDDDDDNSNVLGYNRNNSRGYPSQFPNSPYGQSPYVQSPFVQSPYVQSPYGQSPLVQSPYVQSPYGQSLYGQSPYGQSPLVQSPYGQTPYRQAIMYQSSAYPGTVPSVPNPFVVNYPTVNNLLGTGRTTLIPIVSSNKLYASQIAVPGVQYGIASLAPRYVNSRAAIPIANIEPSNKNVYYPLFPGNPQAVPYGSRAVVNTVQPMFIPPNNNFLLLQPNQVGTPLPNLQNLEPNSAAVIANLINLLSSGSLGLPPLPAGDQVPSGAVVKGA